MSETLFPMDDLLALKEMLEELSSSEGLPYDEFSNLLSFITYQASVERNEEFRRLYLFLDWIYRAGRLETKADKIRFRQGDYSDLWTRFLIYSWQENMSETLG